MMILAPPNIIFALVFLDNIGTSFVFMLLLSAIVGFVSPADIKL